MPDAASAPEVTVKDEPEVEYPKPDRDAIWKAAYDQAIQAKQLARRMAAGSHDSRASEEDDSGIKSEDEEDS
eukprot:9180786-Karenia_brevis.AAC.1